MLDALASLGGGIATGLNPNKTFLGGPQTTNVVVTPTNNNAGDILNAIFGGTASSNSDFALNVDAKNGGVSANINWQALALVVGGSILLAKFA